MATITITCADADLPRVVAGLCAQGNLTVNPANARTVLVNFINNAIIGAETAARQAALQAEMANPPTIVPPVIQVS